MNCMCVLTNCTNGGTYTLSKCLYGTSVSVYSVCSVLSQVSAYLEVTNGYLIIMPICVHRWTLSSQVV